MLSAAAGFAAASSLLEPSDFTTSAAPPPTLHWFAAGWCRPVQPDRFWPTVQRIVVPTDAEQRDLLKLSIMNVKLDSTHSDRLDPSSLPSSLSVDVDSAPCALAWHNDDYSEVHCRRSHQAPEVDLTFADSVESVVVQWSRCVDSEAEHSRVTQCRADQLPDGVTVKTGARTDRCAHVIVVTFSFSLPPAVRLADSAPPSLSPSLLPSHPRRLALDLLLSCYVFPRKDQDRWGVFMLMLRSISHIPFDNVYVFVQIDAAYAEHVPTFAALVEAMFPMSSCTVRTERWVLQHQWTDMIAAATSMDDVVGHDGAAHTLVERQFYFVQNDDHIFIDLDLTVLVSGLHLMSDVSPTSGHKPHRTLYLSHHPEMLLLSGKFLTPDRRGSFVRFNTTLLDSVQVVSLSWLRWVFLELTWPEGEWRRIDGVRYDPDHAGTRDRPRSDITNDQFSQTTYVPLRELCRKARAYPHIGLSLDCTPSVPVAEGATPECSMRPFESEAVVRRAMDPATDDGVCRWRKPDWGWTRGNSFRVPEQWKNDAVQLYDLGREGRSQCSPFAWCGRPCS